MWLRLSRVWPRPAISQYCRDWVATYGSQERMVDAYVKVYIQLLEQEKARAHHATPPWGHWEVLLDTPTYKVKRLTVWPGKDSVIRNIFGVKSIGRWYRRSPHNPQ